MAEFIMGILSLGSGVFIASAFAKLRSRPAYRDYRAGLRATSLVPVRLLNGTAVTLAAVEAATAGSLAGAGVLLAAGSPDGYPLARLALAAAAALTAALTAGVAVVLSRGTTAPCACFGGTSARPLGAAHLVRNAGLLALLAAGLAASTLQHDRPGLAGSGLAAAAGLIAALLVIRWDDLATLFAPVRPAPGTTPAPAPAVAPAPAGRPDRAAR